MGKGLETKEGSFFLDGRRTRLISGALHYFRIPREYWMDRFIKLRACGCNAVETYVPWNFHEPTRGNCDFGGFLDIRKYIKMAASCGLYVIFRPGPYICSEWDFGGLPSWLLTDPDMKVRSTYKPYMNAVTAYFSQLIPLIADLQYSRGGPIIAFQIENEYGSYGNETEYMVQLKELMVSQGVVELMFTSDNDQGIENGAVNGILMTANFQDVKLGEELLQVLESRQPDMPRMVMEFWTGWFDHWGDEKHNVFPIEKYEEALKYALESYGNVNFYMFHGGTNFEFRNGANEQLFDKMEYEADVTSYDYDALLDEQGQITPKYRLTQKMLSAYQDEMVFLGECLAAAPVIPVKAYGKVKISGYIPFIDVLDSAETFKLKGRPACMEMFPINSGCGQTFGYALYRKEISGGEVHFTGQVRDRAQVFIDGKLVSTFDGNTADYKITLPAGTMDILVENMGRTNYSPFQSDVLNSQRKGINSKVLLTGDELLDWQVFTLDFGEAFKPKIASITPGHLQTSCPAIFTASFEIDESEMPCDSYLDMTGWGKGNVLVNSHNVGRYWPDKGPTKTLFIPGVWLCKGDNQLAIFELEKPASDLTFLDSAIL